MIGNQVQPQDYGTDLTGAQVQVEGTAWLAGVPPGHFQTLQISKKLGEIGGKLGKFGMKRREFLEEKIVENEFCLHQKLRILGKNWGWSTQAKKGLFRGFLCCFHLMPRGGNGQVVLGPAEADHH